MHIRLALHLGIVEGLLKKDGTSSPAPTGGLIGNGGRIAIPFGAIGNLIRGLNPGLG